ncbi:MAG: hypothetical protein WCF65_09845 [Parachlamydiaceae bacterium]
MYKENSFKKWNDPKITKKQGRDSILFFALGTANLLQNIIDSYSNRASLEQERMVG